MINIVITSMIIDRIGLHSVRITITCINYSVSNIEKYHSFFLLLPIHSPDLSGLLRIDIPREEEFVSDPWLGVKLEITLILEDFFSRVPRVRDLYLYSTYACGETTTGAQDIKAVKKY